MERVPQETRTSRKIDSGFGRALMPCTRYSLLNLVTLKTYCVLDKYKHKCDDVNESC